MGLEIGKGSYVISFLGIYGHMIASGRTGIIIFSAIAADESHNSIDTSTPTRASLLKLSKSKIKTKAKQKDVKLREGLAGRRELLA